MAEIFESFGGLECFFDGSRSGQLAHILYELHQCRFAAGELIKTFPVLLFQPPGQEPGLVAAGPELSIGGAESCQEGFLAYADDQVPDFPVMSANSPGDQLSGRSFKQCGGLFFPGHGKKRIHACFQGVLFQHSQAKGMKGADMGRKQCLPCLHPEPEALRVFFQFQMIVYSLLNLVPDALFHLAGRFFREGDGQDLFHFEPFQVSVS